MGHSYYQYRPTYRSMLQKVAKQHSRTIKGDHRAPSGPHPSTTPSGATRTRTNQHPRSALSEALLAQIAATPYVKPGKLRPEGPRHDNDDDDFQSIEIAPTNQELQCELPPALPINHPTAPHHLPLGTMKRHLDVHFRLYREEFV